MSSFNYHVFVTSRQWSNNCSFKWSQTPILSKIMFGVSMWIIVLQLIAIIHVLYSTPQLACQASFRLFLSVYATRSSICTPFGIYLHFGYTRPSEYDDEEDMNLIQLEMTRQRLKKIHRMMNLFSIVWFFFGNYLIYYSDTTTCDLTAEKIYMVTYSIVIYGYVIAIAPIIYSFSTCLVVPCLMHSLQNMHFIKTQKQLGISSTDMLNLPTHLSPTLSEKENSLCVICLSHYRENQYICKLWCGHHFHKKCVFEWLKRNPKCPLCKRDCRNQIENLPV